MNPSTTPDIYSDNPKVDLAYMCAVMERAKEGKPVQSIDRKRHCVCSSEWEDCAYPIWSWDACHYRIDPSSRPPTHKDQSVSYFEVWSQRTMKGASDTCETQLNRAIEEAWKRGAAVEYILKDADMQHWRAVGEYGPLSIRLRFDCYDYRLAPAKAAPKMVPWTLDTYPLGAVIRSNRTPNGWFVPTHVHLGGACCVTQGSTWTVGWDELLTNWEWAPVPAGWSRAADLKWYPCGKEVTSS